MFHVTPEAQSSSALLLRPASPSLVLVLIHEVCDDDGQHCDDDDCEERHDLDVAAAHLALELASRALELAGAVSQHSGLLVNVLNAGGGGGRREEGGERE